MMKNFDFVFKIKDFMENFLVGEERWVLFWKIVLVVSEVMILEVGRLVGGYCGYFGERLCIIV